MSNRATVRPTFVNVGPGRSGTSWLFEMLRSHFEVSMSRVKETEYFNTNYGEGEEWYLSHFSGRGRAVGEISNMYYVDPLVPERIKQFSPDMKIIFNIRDPEMLLGSMLAYADRRGLDTSDAAILDAPVGRVMGSGYDSRRAAGNETTGDEVPLKEAVLLTRFLKPYWDVFGRNQVYLLIYERISTEPAALLSELFTFLGVDPTLRPPQLDRVVNEAIQPRVRWIGAMAPRVSFVLRRMGAYGTLSRLHRSRLVKKIFFRVPSGSVPALALPESVERSLAEERQRLLEMIPDLDRIWKLRRN